jgi:hypothetical protein
MSVAHMLAIGVIDWITISFFLLSLFFYSLVTFCVNNVFDICIAKHDCMIGGVKVCVISVHM